MKTKVWECFNNSTHTTCHKIKQLYLTEEIQQKIKKNWNKKKLKKNVKHTHLFNTTTTNYTTLSDIGMYVRKVRKHTFDTYIHPYISGEYTYKQINK